jgi:plasmid stabilization system protein ParE
MMRVIRSPRASRDIIEVLAYTKERRGIVQAREYRELLKEGSGTLEIVRFLHDAMDFGRHL